MGEATQNANIVIEVRKGMVPKTFHTPNLSANTPARTRPTKLPAWRIATE